MRSSPTAVRSARSRARKSHVAVVHRLDVEVDAVEALVHEAAALGHDALALAEVAQVERPGPRRAGSRTRRPPTQGSTFSPGATRRAAARKARICSRLCRGRRPAALKGMRWGNT